MNSKNEKAQGCGCGVDFRKEVNDLVKEGSKPTKAQHDKRKAEVDAAFKSEKKAPAKKTAAKK